MTPSVALYRNPTDDWCNGNTDDTSSEDEAPRLERLHLFNILDRPYSQEFDHFATMAAATAGTTFGFITLVDFDRTWIFAGNDATRAMFPRECPRRSSGCHQVVVSKLTVAPPPETLDLENVLIVPDTLEDEQFPKATSNGKESIRFYAGTPLCTTPDPTDVDQRSYRIGCLGVADTTPIPNGLTPVQKNVLVLLARKIMIQIESNHRNVLA